MSLEFKLPDVGEGTTEGQIVRWLVSEGEWVDLDQPLVEVETDKAVVELPAPAAGRILKRMGREGEVMAVGSTLVVIEDGSESAHNSPQLPLDTSGAAGTEHPDPRSAGNSQHQPAPAPNPDGEVRAAPFTRRLARESGVDLSAIAGSGPRGRIRAEDVRRAAAREDPEPSERHLWTFSALRQKISNHLTESVRTIPHVTVVERFDATALMAAREALNEERDRNSSVKVSYLAMMAKAICVTAQAYPELNARWEGGQLYLYDRVHLGVAVDTDWGLVVPVVRRADARTIPGIAQEIALLAEQAREKKLGADKMSGSTITVTGGGPLGGLFATPIINAPEVAIVGMYPIVYEVRKMSTGMEERAMIYFTLTFDHRVIDGVKASRSVALLKHLLENPVQLLGHLR